MHRDRICLHLFQKYLNISVKNSDRVKDGVDTTLPVYTVLVCIGYKKRTQYLNLGIQFLILP